AETLPVMAGGNAHSLAKHRNGASQCSSSRHTSPPLRPGDARRSASGDNAPRMSGSDASDSEDAVFCAFVPSWFCAGVQPALRHKRNVHATHVPRKRAWRSNDEKALNMPISSGEDREYEVCSSRYPRIRSTLPRGERSTSFEKIDRVDHSESNGADA